MEPEVIEPEPVVEPVPEPEPKETVEIQETEGIQPDEVEEPAEPASDDTNNSEPIDLNINEFNKDFPESSE